MYNKLYANKQTTKMNTNNLNKMNVGVIAHINKIDNTSQLITEMEKRISDMTSEVASMKNDVNNSKLNMGTEFNCMSVENALTTKSYLDTIEGNKNKIVEYEISNEVAKLLMSENIPIMSVILNENVELEKKIEINKATMAEMIKKFEMEKNDMEEQIVANDFKIEQIKKEDATLQKHINHGETTIDELYIEIVTIEKIVDEDKNIVNQTKQVLLETVNKIELTTIDILCQWLSIYIYIVLSVFIIIFIDNKYNCKPTTNKKGDIVVKYGIEFEILDTTTMVSRNYSVIINNTNCNLSIYDNNNLNLNLFVDYNDKRIEVIEYTNNYEGNKLQYNNKFIERCDYERPKNNYKMENNHMEKEDVNVDKIFYDDFNFCGKKYKIFSYISTTYSIDFTGIEYPYYWFNNTNKSSNSHKYVKNSSIRIGKSSWDYRLLFKDDKLVGYINKENNIQHVLLM